MLTGRERYHVSKYYALAHALEQGMESLTDQDSIDRVGGAITGVWGVICDMEDGVTPDPRHVERLMRRAERLAITLPTLQPA